MGISSARGLEFKLLNEFQRDFPFASRPFAIIAERLGVSEMDVIEILKRLQVRGCVSRVGAVFAPRHFGASTLAALAVPQPKLESIAARVGAFPEVNHNYEREHRYNLWFVVTAPDALRLDAVLSEIETESGCEMISLPLLEEFHIDLGFDLNGGTKRLSRPRKVDASSTSKPNAFECRVVTALGPGLDIVPRPFAALACRAGAREKEVLALLTGWRASGVLKRFGVVVRHHELGYRANAMVVWDVPDECAGELGSELAREPGVTLCYLRRRQPPQWRYNLFCMIHGTDRVRVECEVHTLRSKLGPYPHALLFSSRRFKQCGARYTEVAEHGHG